MTGGVALRAGSATDTGLVRANNQDALLVAHPLFAVADGMGGHAAGEVASEVAVEALRAYADAEGATARERLVQAVRRANRAVWARADDDPDLRGMGTTLCAIALVPPPPDTPDEGDRVVVVNVGDSRVYLFHDGGLDQVTEDHSLVEDLVREGRLSPEEARVHPQRNILTRVLGNEPDVEVDSWEVDPVRGDRFLLCSDGLFNEVDDDRIAAVLRRLAGPDDAARELVRLAREGGGRDNITVVVVDVVDDGGAAEAASAALAGEPAATGTTPDAAPPAPSAGTPAPGEGEGEGDDGSRPSSAAGLAPDQPAEPPALRGRRLTWRSALFVVAVLAVLGGAAAAVAWFAGNAYYVGVDGDEVAIFRGRPGGLLWIDPELVERTGLALDDVPVARRAAVLDGKQEPSLDDARSYVENLEAQRAGERPTSTTTTSPSTTAPPGPTSTAPTQGTTTTP